jgi:hypothetical protein
MHLASSEANNECEWKHGGAVFFSDEANEKMLAAPRGRRHQPDDHDGSANPGRCGDRTIISATSKNGLLDCERPPHGSRGSRRALCERSAAA